MNCDKCTYQHNPLQSRCHIFPSAQKVLSYAYAVTPTSHPIAWLALDNYWSALCHCKLVMPAVEFHISRIVRSVFFDICFLLLCISSFTRFFKFIHFPACFTNFFFIPLYRYTTICLFINLFADQHLGHFQLGTVMSKSPVNICSRVYMCSFLMDKCLRVE